MTKLTPAERREIKRGKHERIQQLLNDLKAKQPKPIDDLMREIAELHDFAGRNANNKFHKIQKEI